MFDMLNMCVNEARIVTCIVNHTKTDRETQKNLQDYLGVVGGVWRVFLIFLVILYAHATILVP